MATVTFTQNLQRLVKAEPREVPGATVREALEAVFAQVDGLRSYVLDDQGALRHHMIIFVDGAQIRDRATQGDPVGPAAQIHVMQALSGG